LLNCFVIFFLLGNGSFQNLNQSYVARNLNANHLQLLFSLLVVHPSKSLPSLVGALPFMAVMIVFAMNPLQSLLKYSFTLAHISAFVTDNGMHPLSPDCDNVSGCPLFDSILGIPSTIIAWLLVVPIISLLADVLVPGKLPPSTLPSLPPTMTWTTISLT
jgi:hypothetical protein